MTVPIKSHWTIIPTSEAPNGSIVIFSTSDQSAKDVKSIIVEELMNPTDRIPGYSGPQSRGFFLPCTIEQIICWTSTEKSPLSRVYIKHQNRRVVMNEWASTNSDIPASIRGMSMVRAFRWSYHGIINSQSQHGMESSVELWRNMNVSEEDV